MRACMYLCYVTIMAAAVVVVVVVARLVSGRDGEGSLVRATDGSSKGKFSVVVGPSAYAKFHDSLGTILASSMDGLRKRERNKGKGKKKGKGKGQA